MPLKYEQWGANGTSTRWWTVKGKEGSVDDVGIGDKLSFSVDWSATPPKIKIVTVACSHTPTHTGKEWTGICEKVGDNEVKGTMTTSRAEFRIASSEVDDGGGRKHNKLTFHVPPATGQPVGPGGGVCWTAEDG